VIGSRSIYVKRHASSTVDVEGRPVAGALSTVSTVSGHLFVRQATSSVDGRTVLVNRVMALLPEGTDVRASDLLEAVDEPGVLYRVGTVIVRRSPFGGVHHLTVECEVSN
jgi:hypothetical protein